MKLPYLTPVLIGRTSERVQLIDTFEDVARGASRAVLVAGEAGIGKSRLVDDLLARVGDRARLLSGGCVDLRATELPYAPFVAALRPLANDISALLPHGADAVAALLPGAGMQAARPADDDRARMFEGLLALFGALTSEDLPCVVVVEDIHWADRSSLDLVDYLIRSLPATPRLLVVATFRSVGPAPVAHFRTVVAELERLGWVQRLDLRRLTRPETTELARALLGTEPDPDLVSAVQDRSDGNPLFAEELLRSDLRHSGPPAAGAGPLDLPASLNDLLLDHVRRLSDAARTVVDATSVASYTVAHRVLARVVERSTVDSGATVGFTDLDAGLRTAVDGSVLVVSGDGYSFRHSLIRDAVYGDLLPSVRTRLHRHYADVLTEEQLPAASIAEHLFSAGDAVAALPIAWQASRQAHRALAYSEELTLLQYMLRNWAHLDDRPEGLGVDRTSVLEKATEAAARSGRHADGADLATDALAALDPVTDRVRMALVLERRARMRTSLGDPADLGDYRRAVEVAPEDHPARALVLNALADRLMTVPAPDEAQDVAAEALAIAHRQHDPANEASALITLATARARLGDLDNQLPRLQRARHLAESVGATNVALRAVLSESHLLQAYGRLEGAAALAREGVGFATSVGLARSAAPAYTIVLAGSLLEAGRWPDTDQAIESGIALAPPPGDHAHLLCLKAFLALYRGDTDSAERLLADGRELVSYDTSHGTDSEGQHRSPLAQDAIPFERLAAELRLALGRYDEAVQIVLDTVRREELLPATRFLWPLLVIGARATALDGSAPGGPALDELRARAASLRASTPVQEAWRATFTALTGDDGAAWTDALEAWSRLGHPFRAAQVGLEAGQAALRASDRATGRDLLEQARRQAAQLGAATLSADATRLLGRSLARPETGFGLTGRELEVLRLVTAGRSNAQIASELVVAPKTVSAHVSHILAKLGVANRLEAAAIARNLGLTDPA